MPVPLTRRTLLRAALVGGAAAVLVGCDAEDRPARTTPEPPPVRPDDPTTWPADSDLLITLRERIHGNLASSRRVEGPSTALRGIQEHWGTQIARLEELVTAGGVPLPDLPELPPQAERDDAASTEEPEDTAGSTRDPDAGTDTISARELATALRGQLPGLTEQISGASPLNLPFLVSLVGHQAAATIRLGAPVAWEPLAGPVGAAAVPLLAAARPAVYGLEVVAAKSFGEERETYERVLEGVRGLTRQLTSLAGPAAPVAPLGYDLPEPLDDEERRGDLARALVADLAPAALRTADRVAGGAEELLSLVRVVAEAVTWGRRLGASGEAFPGMTLP